MQRIYDSRVKIKKVSELAVLPEYKTSGASGMDLSSVEEITLKLIPYYAFANRGPSEMYVWLLKK